MFLPQWLLEALQRVLCGHAGSHSPLKAILLLWHFFRRLFLRFSRTRDDGTPDKYPQHKADQVSYLPQSVESTKCTMSLAVDDNEDDPVLAVAYRSTALPNDLRSSHDTALVASHSQTGLAFKSDLNPSDGHPPLHGSRSSSITPSSIEGSLYSSARSTLSRFSQGISGTVHNSAVDAHLNSSHVYLQHATSDQEGLLFDSEAVVVPLSPTTTQRDGCSQHGVSNSTLHDAYPYTRAVAPENLGSFLRNRSVRVYGSFGLLF